MNGILGRFQHYCSHITMTAHIIHVFPGFTGLVTRLGLRSVLLKGTPTTKRCGSNVPSTVDISAYSTPVMAQHNECQDFPFTTMLSKPVF